MHFLAKIILHFSADLSKTVYVDDDQFDFTDYQSDETVSFKTDIRSGNYLSGSIELKHAGILYLAIPDTEGWTCSVDGTETSIVSVNGGFIGIPLSEGSHIVELNFMSPGLKKGLVMSAAGVALLISICMKERHKKMKISA